MENTDDKIRTDQGHNSRIWVALTLVAVGGALLARQIGFPLPDWLFSWQMLLIVIGVFQGFSHGFRGAGWAILIIIGGFFLIDNIMPGFSLHRFIWPFAIIAVGLLILVRPGRHADWGRRGREEWKQKWKEKEKDWKNYGSHFKGSYSSENFIDATTVFGGIHKTVVSKDFKGGDITVFMGGAQIDLSQADINGTAMIDITQIMGGTKLIVPPHWEIRSQLTSVFGNIEDKRQQDRISNPDKVLIIDGTSIFGGIEIRNY
jgi:predicted membrane protein